VTVKPCRHTRRAVVGFEARPVELSGGQLWRVREDLRCAKCGELSRRWSRKGYLAESKRDCLKRYGAPLEDLPAPADHTPGAAAEVPLTSWPFPVSTYFPTKGATR
jgi:hypothetical protein